LSQRGVDAAIGGAGGVFEPGSKFRVIAQERAFTSPIWYSLR